MRALTATFFLLAAPPVAAHGQVRNFPYQAVVEDADVYVRSGPGRKYYPTGRLSRGDRVIVHRHDPGGWYMIAPPPGSFSWIRAEYVKSAGQGRGVLTQNNVVVRVGSALDDSHDIEQRRLSRGDSVEVLEQVTLDTGRGPTQMYKIKPPAGEYRWISGQYVTPVDEIARQQHDRDPFKTPSTVKRAGQGDEAATARSNDKNDFVERPLVRTTNQKAVRRTGPSSDDIQADRDRLKELDIQFREIVKKEKAEWIFDGLESSYTQLQGKASSPALISQIELRLDAVERYRKIKEEYDEFVRLTSETDKRDAELLAVQRQPKTHEPQEESAASETFVTPQSAGSGLSPGPNSTALPGRSFSLPVDPSASIGGPPRHQRLPRQPRHRPHFRWGSILAPHSPRQPSRRPIPPFVGAGILQRTVGASGSAPGHVLTAPNGTILAYLQGSQGVNLDQFVGRAVGLHGQRMHRQDLQMDFVVVQSLTPVRLTP